MQTTEVKVTRTCPACHCPTHLWQDSSGSGWIHDRAVDEHLCCPACHRPTHLWQDSSGSGWIHDRAVDEHLCWRENRAAYEDSTL
jgi:hypothetical protein